MIEFEKLEPKVVKPGERVDFQRDSMPVHGWKDLLNNG